MEIRITSKQILFVLYILAWIIFIGLCMEAGGILFNAFYTMFYNPVGAGFFWNKMDLSGLFAADKGYFIVVTILMSIVAILKAIQFYIIIRAIHHKKLNFTQPFNQYLPRFISYLSWLAIGIGIFSSWGTNQTKWLVAKGISLPDIQKLGFGGADVWFFMGGVLIVIAQICKRGVELQTENDLTT